MLQEVMHAVSGHHGDQYGRPPQDLPFVSTTLGTGDPFRCSIATDRATSTGSGSSLRACADISPRHARYTPQGIFEFPFRIHARAVKERYPYVRLGVQTCQTPPTPSPVVWPGPVSPE